MSITLYIYDVILFALILIIKELIREVSHCFNEKAFMTVAPISFFFSRLSWNQDFIIHLKKLRS